MYFCKHHKGHYYYFHNFHNVLICSCKRCGKEYPSEMKRPTASSHWSFDLHAPQCSFNPCILSSCLVHVLGVLPKCVACEWRTCQKLFVLTACHYWALNGLVFRLRSVKMEQRKLNDQANSLVDLAKVRYLWVNVWLMHDGTLEVRLCFSTNLNTL